MRPRKVPTGADTRALTSTARFLFEAGHLKRVRRSGWWLAGIDSPESVAEHSFRTAIIGFVLACLDGADPHRTACLCLFHDFPESRINDPHPLAKKYLSDIDPGVQIFGELVESFPVPLAKQFSSLAGELTAVEHSPEYVLAKDADLLECALQAREYESQGILGAASWITPLRRRLKTRVAVGLLDRCLAIDPADWWQSLLEEHSRSPHRTGRNKYS